MEVEAPVDALIHRRWLFLVKISRILYLTMLLHLH